MNVKSPIWETAVLNQAFTEPWQAQNSVKVFRAEKGQICEAPSDPGASGVHYPNAPNSERTG